MDNWLENVLLRMDGEATKGSADACIELANLYRNNNKPLAALAFGRKAKRLGTDIELSPLETAVDHLRSTEWSKDVAGCYRLGVELSSYPMDHSDLRKAISFLKAVITAEDAIFVGHAALCLADLLRSMGENVAEAYHYYEVAERNGSPDILFPLCEQARKTSVA